MPIEFRCSSCGKLLRVADDSAGKKSRCPECSNIQTIPNNSTSGYPEAPPPSSPFSGGAYPHAGSSAGSTPYGNPTSESPPFGSAPQQPTSPSGPASPGPAPTTPKPGAVPMGGPQSSSPQSNTGSAFPSSFPASPYAETPVSNNPYAASTSGYSSYPPGGPLSEDAARGRLLAPGIILIVFAVFGLMLAALGSLGFFVQMMENRLKDDDILAVIIVIANVPLQLMMLIGAIQMIRLRSYSLALTAAIAGMIPCGMCCFFVMPFGIWALVVLCNADVRGFFR